MLPVGHHQGMRQQGHDSNTVKGKETNQHIRRVLKGTADSQEDKKPKINNQVERVEESAPGVPASLENQTQPRTNLSWKKR